MYPCGGQATGKLKPRNRKKARENIEHLDGASALKKMREERENQVQV